ncbi:uncharacterized protein LOC111345388 [Stylophora pistillata]|uniref:uncharacterized protein LOC111345388 n=1 Tax=Stylophora pistillata TaxID=50429 RepID=UPI000C044B8C|nr:uncharacterized protein LOC111345388 [Stylophora pistillata]
MWRCESPRKKLYLNTTESLFLGSIQVKHCWARNFTAIKLTTVIEFPTKKLADTILKEVINSFGYEANQEQIERALLSVTDLEEFIGKYSQYHLNETAPKIYIRSEHADILVRKIFNENESDVQLGDDKGENLLSLPTAGLDNGWRVIYLV